MSVYVGSRFQGRSNIATSESTVCCLEIPATVHPEIWGSLPTVSGARVARVDSLEVSATEVQETVYIYLPGLSEVAGFNTFRRAVVESGWTIVPPQLKNGAFLQNNTGWLMLLFGTDFPPRDPSKGRTIFADPDIYSMQGSGVGIQIGPPIR